jgi:membrane-associated phospholipid phosphatase
MEGRMNVIETLDRSMSSRLPAHAVRGARTVGSVFRLSLLTALLATILIGMISADFPHATDLRIAGDLHARATPLLTMLMRAVSASHGLVAIGTMSCLVAIYFARVGPRRWLLLTLIATPGGMLLNAGLKLAFERTRPHFDDSMVVLYTYSFPSGHTAGSTVFYGILGSYLVTRTTSRPLQTLIVVVSFLMILLVAASRLYLGAHYLSDVLAGFVESMAWLTLCVAIVDVSLRDALGWTPAR